ncbi:MAG: cytochrome C, partial [Acidobacteria bacterium]
MPQIFHRSTNTFSKLSIFGAVFIIAAIAAVLTAINRSGYVTEAGVSREQPVPFSHRHHVGGMGIDCRYCHTSVENAAFANIPPTKTC